MWISEQDKKRIKSGFEEQLHEFAIEDFEVFMNALIDEVKEKDGFDIRNHTQEEWNEYWMKLCRKEAETDRYTEEILKITEQIIENKEYSHLFAIMRNYDELVKGNVNRYRKENGLEPLERQELPYWCYAFGMDPEKEN